MNYHENLHFCGINKDELNKYMKAKIIKCDDEEIENHEYTENDVKKIGYAKMLMKIGFDMDMVKELSDPLCSCDNTIEKRIRKKRCAIIEDIHEKQQYIDVIDQIIRDYSAIKKRKKG